jgi:hypothetical protein
MSNEINCGIFRHAVMKTTGEQINQHETKEKCSMLMLNDLVFGCSKPFRLMKMNNAYVAEICDYV